MRRLLVVTVVLSATAAFLVPTAGPASSRGREDDLPNVPAPLSGVAEFADLDLGTGITECPQAGMNTEPQAVDRRATDTVEKLGGRGDDTRGNTEYSCFPQNETAIDVNPRNAGNIVGGANDYRMGGAFGGFYATSDGGRHWYDGLIPVPSVPSGNMLDSAGDPAIAFDRGGTVYYADITFDRTTDDNGIWVSRLTNGGFTWSRPCAPINVGTPTDDVARCGGPGDPRHPGDGVIVYQPDNDPTPGGGSSANFSVTFHDKEYIATGPRPDGIEPTCFAPETKTPIPAGSPGCPESVIGPDRVYVTWTAFNNPSGVPFAIVNSTIEMSFSDDRGRSWSPRKKINGNAPFCVGATAGPTFCDDNQFSVPTVSPHSGHLYVAFENFDTPDENQWLVVRSRDGGATFEGPFFITPTFDVNLRSRPDCAARGSGSAALTNSCFRVPMTGAVVVDPRAGEFMDDLYFVVADNRNGTRESTNTDVFTFKSINGGTSWIGPSRVNNDPSAQPANRNCGRGTEPPCPVDVHTGNDNWWPWIDVSDEGDLNIKFLDRRLDTDSLLHEWPTSRRRPGNYLVWTWGAQCRVRESTATPGTACTAPTAAPIPQPVAPINPGNDAFPEQTVFPFRNFQISDVPSNFDYCFRAGIFCGDYESIAVGPSGTAWVLFTDARNGRSSGGPAGTGTFPSQPGRNPACEQSDVFVDRFSAANGGSGGSAGDITPFLVTPCPGN